MFSKKHTDFFQALLGARATVQPDDLLEYGRDRTRVFSSKASIILFPKATAEVQTIVRYCSDSRLAFVPSGGRTGYAGAAMATNGEVVISFEKMNRIVQIDLESGTAEAESGVILENLQLAVAEKGMMFPIDFGARGSCQIGGCISTNAGGHKVIKYGMTREQVLGLEVVTPQGEILNLNANLHKNNSGYDLKQLFIGAEGTLGLITRATLRLVPKPARLQLSIIAFNQLNNALSLLRHARLTGLNITAYEFIAGPCMEAVQAYRPQSLHPFSATYPFYALLEIDESAIDRQTCLESLFDQSVFEDAVIASTPEIFKSMWALRDTISESIFHMGRFHKSDVAVPVSKMADFVKALEDMLTGNFSDCQIFLFGHIGDGNIHVNLVDRNQRGEETFSKETEKMESQICELIRRYDGSISAEHGIGLLKKNLLAKRRPPQDLVLMRNLKAVLDPLNLCNPGKIVD